MKKKILIVPFILFLLFSFKEKLKHKYSDDKFWCVYETNDGRLNGIYTSYYNNGKLKAKGKFENNCRIGKWSVWDTLGKLSTQRVYNNLYTFKKFFPKTPNDKLVKLLNIPPYTLTYNKDGYINLFYIHERAVYWEDRVYRILTETNNDQLFEKDKLINLMQKNILNDSIKSYSGYEFWNEVKYKNIDTLNEKIIAFKIIEDNFFDIDRFVSEKRILGICPLIYNKLKKDTSDLYWIYYPQLRKYLAKEKINTRKTPINIKTIDDLFFFRYFSSVIIETSSNIYQNEKIKNKSTKINPEKTEIRASLKINFLS